MQHSHNLTAALSRPCRQHAMQVFARGGGRGQGRPPPRPQPPPDKRRFNTAGGAPGGGGGRKDISQPLISLQEMAGNLKRVWSKVTKQRVDVDPATGLCVAPSQPGQIGRPVKLQTNHLAVTTTSTFSASSIYSVSITAHSPQQPASDSLSLEQRKELLAQLASQQSWADGSWQYDASSQTLYSTADHLAGPSGALQANVSLKTSSAKSKSTTQPLSWTVAVTRSSTVAAAAPAAPEGPNGQQLLSLLLRASVAAAVQQLGGVLSAASAGLLPPGVLGVSPSSSSSTSGGPGGGAARGRGGGRGGGRDGGMRGGGTRSRGRGNFPGVLQVCGASMTAHNAV